MSKTVVLISKLLCDWSDKFTLLVHYSLRKSLSRHGKIVGKDIRVDSFKVKLWLET